VPRLFRLILLPVSLLLAAAAPDAIVAQRGDARMTAAEVEQMLDVLDPATRQRIRASPTALAEMVRDRVLRDAVLAEARAAKWDVRPEIAARAEDARVQVIVQSFIASQTLPTLAEPTEQEITAAYEASRARLTVPKQYNLAQIAILVPPDASREAEEALRKKILDIRAQALKPRADFAEIARKLSQDRQTAEKGGDLGWVREDVLIPAIRAAVGSMKDNTISEPIRSGESWHIVRLSGTRPPGVMPLDQARGGIVQALKQARAQAAARAFLQAMMQKEPIRLNEIELSRQFPPPPAASGK
jgi:peptidylprolyl isomerase